MSASPMDDQFSSHEHVLLLKSTTPGLISTERLQDCFRWLTTRDRHGYYHHFDNRHIFITDPYRTETLYNVGAILDGYNEDLINKRRTQANKTEKELLWVAMHLYARLQAIRDDVGVVLEPMTEYQACLERLARCKTLLTANRSDTALIAKLCAALPVMPALERNQDYERWFKGLIDQIDRRNDTRLYWVWGRSTLDLVLGFAEQTDAQSRLSGTTYIPSQISWSLYLFRGSLFAYQYAKKRCYDPLWFGALSVDEQETYRQIHQQVYWDILKYRILNDYVWGPINLFSCYWWVGDGIYGWFNDFATCFLLGMDLYLANKECNEAKATFDRIQDDYRQQLRLLVFDSDDWNFVYKKQQDHLRRGQFKAKVLNYNYLYALALLVAYVMCASLLMSGILPVTIGLFLHVSGTLLCTLLTIVSRTVKVMTQISQVQEAKQALVAQKAQYIQDTEGMVSSALRLQELYLLIKNVEEKVEYADASIRYQYLELARTSLLRVTVPLMIGLVLVYAPASLLMVPTYVFVLAASAAVAYGLDSLAKRYKPDELTALPGFKPDEYQSFLGRLSLFASTPRAQESCEQFRLCLS